MTKKGNPDEAVARPDGKHRPTSSVAMAMAPGLGRRGFAPAPHHARLNSMHGGNGRRRLGELPRQMCWPGAAGAQ